MASRLKTKQNGMETHQYGLNLLQCIILFGELYCLQRKKSFIAVTTYGRHEQYAYFHFVHIGMC